MRETLKDIRERLGHFYDRGEREAIIRLIFHYLKGWSQVDMIVNEDKNLSDYMKRKINEIVDRLILGEPIQYITGEARFYGMDFHVRPGVLIPRPETEELVDWIKDENAEEDLHVLDIGTGSGCIAVALSRVLPFSQVTAIDISDTALQTAKENASDLKAKIDFKKEDMYTWLPEAGALDIVVSNPPYIAEDERKDMEVRVKDYEPSIALFVSNDDPVRPYRRIEEIARTGLRPGGKVYLELNPRFADDVKKYYESKGWRDVEVRIDSHGKKRMMKGVRG